MTEPAGGGPPRAGLRVRPYLVTGGRTRAPATVDLETMVRTIERPATATVTATATGAPSNRPGSAGPEARRILLLCRNRSLSVAEVSAHLALPLQVTKVLVGDLVADGRLESRSADTTTNNRPDIALLERVLDGLQRL